MQQMAQGRLTDPERPRLVGLGPAECSSSRALSVLPMIIWDVNGYYRELGVSPWADRRALREAYQAKDGQSSVRLTYILKQLLNPEIRRAYDLTDFGHVFMDRYVEEHLRRIAMTRKSERIEHLHDLGVDLEGVDFDSIERDIYDEMGVAVTDRDTPLETVDGHHRSGQDQHRPAEHFRYAFYLWKVYRQVDLSDLERLSQWQRFLVSSFSREGIRIKFAVGFHGQGPHRWLYAGVGYRKVFLLGIKESPTEELASDVARQVARDLGIGGAPAVAAPLAITGR